MEDKTRYSDIMGIYNSNDLFQPYLTEDGWTVTQPGEEDGRRKKYNKTLVAETKVEIKLKDEESLNICLKELEESDRRIRELSGGGSYDWQKVLVKDLVVRFGVAWYNLEFFEQKKEVWSDPNHASVFKKFGAGIKDFTVSHTIV
jgi:hypothetical protein